MTNEHPAGGYNPKGAKMSVAKDMSYIDYLSLVPLHACAKAC